MRFGFFPLSNEKEKKHHLIQKGAFCFFNSHHSLYVSTSRSLKSALRSTILTCLGSLARVSCVVACGRQQKAASTWSQFTSAILVSGAIPAVAAARCGYTSEYGFPACESPVSATRSRPGCPAARRTTSSPVYPEAPRTATRAGVTWEEGEEALAATGA